MDYLNQALKDSGVEPVDTSNFVLPGGIITKDGDTFKLPDGKTMRLQGVNTAETQKTGRTVESFKAGDLGADTQHQITRDAIVRFGFNKPVLSGTLDPDGRYVGDLENEKGERLSDYLLTNRLADPLMATQDQRTRIDVADLYRAKSKLDFAPMSIADVMHKALNEERNLMPLTPKPFANTAAQYGASLDDKGNNPYYTAPGYIKGDEDYKGEARSNLATGLKVGFEQATQGVYNVLDMLGTGTGDDFIKTIGQANSRNERSIISNLPTLKDSEAFDEQGNWKLDSFSKAGNYLVGTAAASTPQMIMSLLATAAAPMTYGVSLSVPALVYAGQTWENQKEKDIGWALTSGITQATIEMLGVSGKFTSIFKRDAQEAIIKQLELKGMTRYEAEQALITKTQQAIKQVTEATKAVEGGMLKQSGRAAVRGLFDEAPEEMLQELTQYFGEERSFDLPDDPADFAKLQNRIINAGVGGAVLGPTFAVGSTVLRNLGKGPHIDSQALDIEFREKQMSIIGRVPTANEIINDANNQIADINNPPALNNLKSAEVFKRNASGVVGSVVNWWQDKGLSSLYDKWSNTLAGNDSHKGNYTAALFSLLGANRAFNGGSIEEQQARVTTELQNSFGTPTMITNDFGMPMSKVSGIVADPKVQSTIVKLIETMEASGDASTKEALQYYTDNNKIDSMLGSNSQYKSAIAKYADRIYSLVNSYNSRTGSKLTVKDFLELKPVNKNAIQSNKIGFASLLSKHLGITQEEANNAVSMLLGDPTSTFVSDPFDDLFNTNPNAVNIQNKIKNVLSDPTLLPEFAKYLNLDINENAYGLAAKGGSAYVNKNLIGNEGNHLASLIQSALNNGEITNDKASFLAKELSDWLDMRKGVYHDVINKNKYAMGALSTINFLNMVVSLPLAAISSTVEFAQIYRNLNLTQSAKATMALLEGMTSEVAGAMAALTRSNSDMANRYHNKLYEAGYQSKGDIGKRNDVVHGYYQKWTEGFFKLTGLTSVTNVTRYAKLAIGADAINHWLSVVEQADANNPSQAVKDARAHLVRLGVDVEGLLSIDRDSPANQIKVFDELTRGTHNFVSEAVVSPTKMNRPKFYSDPYLQLFTTFQGYISTFTANVLPRLLGDLRRTGSQDQVNAAATIAMMMFLTYFALSIKDVIKYGESPPQWLKDEKKFQRFVGQSGILGSSQRIWDTVSSVVPESNQNRSVLGQAYKQVSDQAPALSYINKVNDVLSADPGQKTKAVARVLPIFGTSPAFAKYIQQELGDY